MSSKDEDAVSTAEQSGDNVHDIPLQSTELLRKIISFKDINAIAGKRSNSEGLKQSAFHLGCIFATGTIIYFSLYFYHRNPSYFTVSLVTLAMILHGYILSFLFMPLHEFVHMTAFQSPSANRVGAFITGLATTRPPFHYKLYHFAHHRFTGNKKLDPELSDSLLDPNINTLGGYLLYLSSIPFWVSRLVTILRHSLGTSHIDPRGEFYISTEDQKAAIVGEARTFAIIYSLMALWSFYNNSASLLLYWAIPTIIGQPFLRFYLLAEHTGCQLGTNMIANTRTTKTYDFYRKLAWNMPYHAEHHAWPSVPFHHLPLVHSLIKGVSLSQSGCSPSGEKGYFGVHNGVRKSFLA